MVLVNSILALASVVYSIGRWDRMGVHYHSLVQFLLLGLNGAFLTGDLFNLFVFFEILLAASYALLLHGGGPQRTKMSLHFVAVNLTAAFAFLLGVAMIYSVVARSTWRRSPCLAQISATITTSRSRRAILAIAFLVRPRAGR